MVKKNNTDRCKRDGAEVYLASSICVFPSLPLFEQIVGKAKLPDFQAYFLRAAKQESSKTPGWF